ncbi:lamin tail domain-containing protein [Catalinimonas alkaloidigena]|uniref:lamin tail domain-containing protein n=1 Tax=Catalinimonas alkaloidigena TaxID=1075417 RepID=UPI0015A140DA|nr:lamin tail domain-containing protein [Catalinimonas alkaloidigena]
MVDTVAPVLTSVTAISEHELKLAWSEALDPTAAQDTTNYLVPELGAPQTATLLAPDSVLLTFSEAFAIEQDYHLSVIGTSDLAGNLMEPIVLPFHWFPGYYPAQPFEVVIHEIMADPSPPRDLPDAEYLELRNVTSNVLSLTGYRLEDGTGTTTLPELLVQPDELVILCSSSTRSAFSAFGRAVAVPSFPSLRNDGEPLALRAPDGTLIHAVTYSDEWYGDAQKAEGGWSLEMVDATNPCSGRTNWTASVAPPGGTPGQLNSVAASNPDLSKPQLIRVEALAADSLLLVFNESLDSLSLAQGSYVVQPDVSIARVLIAPLQFDRAVLALAAPLQAGQPYTVTVGNMQDCVGNTIEGGQPFSFLLPEPADSGDIILNEILFDPHPGGVDFVELVNVSEKYLQLQGWRLANVEDEQLANERLITTESFVVAPGQYVLLTPDPALTLRDYPKAASENFLPVASLPAFPNDAGSVVLLSPAGQPWQRFDYDVRDHFTLLDDEEGVSLERIRMEGPVNDPSNWQSAAATAGYATPGYRNSQATDPLITQGTLAVEPAVFTPDQDGDRDVTTIRYQFDQSGFVGTLTLYDDHGRVIRQLARNEILGTEGTYKWDGTQDDGRKARIGIYLVLFEVFLLNGHTEIYRDQVVVGSRF